MTESDNGSQQVPLFDPIPKGLEDQEDEIHERYDGTLGQAGIVMVLDPITRRPRKAFLSDMIDSFYKASYSPSARGRWTSIRQVLTPGSREYEKLEAVYRNVLGQFDQWRVANPTVPLRRSWTTAAARNTEVSVSVDASTLPLRTRLKKVEKSPSPAINSPAQPERRIEEPGETSDELRDLADRITRELAIEFGLDPDSPLLRRPK